MLWSVGYVHLGFTRVQYTKCPPLLPFLRRDSPTIFSIAQITFSSEQSLVLPLNQIVLWCSLQEVALWCYPCTRYLFGVPCTRKCFGVPCRGGTCKAGSVSITSCRQVGPVPNMTRVHCRRKQKREDAFCSSKLLKNSQTAEIPRFLGIFLSKCSKGK